MSVIVIRNPYLDPAPGRRRRAWVELGHPFVAGPGVVLTPTVETRETERDAVILTIRTPRSSLPWEFPEGFRMVLLPWCDAILMPRAVEYDLAGRAQRVLLEIVERGGQRQRA